MIKKQQKWIAMLVILTFAWLLQVSTMPLAAAGTTERVSSADSEQGPRFIEEEGSGASAAGKKSILPYILIGVGVIAVAAVLILVVFKTKYDITGSWNFAFTRGANTVNYTIVFTGTKASGNFSFQEDPAIAGTYTVDVKKAVMTVTPAPTIQFTGDFTTKDTMTGIWIEGTSNWTWTATRAAASSGVHPAPTTQSELLPK